MQMPLGFFQSYLLICLDLYLPKDQELRFFHHKTVKEDEQEVCWDSVGTAAPSPVDTSPNAKLSSSFWFRGAFNGSQLGSSAHVSLQ